MMMLLSLLQAQRDWPGRVLAERLEVSPRTVRRDIDRLREMGFRIRTFKGIYGGYRLEAGTEVPPLLFDDDQAVAIAVALQIVAGSGLGIGEAASRALATVRQMMPSRLRHRMDAVSIDAAPPADGPPVSVDPDVLVAVSAAVQACEVLRFIYTTPEETATDEAPRRRVEPHHVVSRRGRWYLVAWDLDRDDWRTFRMDRLSPRTPTGPRFTRRAVPGGDVSTFLGARFKGSSGPDAWPCVGEVILNLPAGVVTPFAGSAIVEALGPDRCQLVAGSWSWTALAASFGRFDADIHVVGPPELATAFGQLAHRFADASRPQGAPQ